MNDRQCDYRGPQRAMNGSDRLHLPAAMRPMVEGAEFEPVHIGESAAAVFRVKTTGKTFFLKACAAASEGGLDAEAERLRWLAGRAPVPEVVSFEQEDGREYLLLTSLSGMNGVEASRAHPVEVVSGLAEALKGLHGTPVAGCLFDQSVAAQVDRARRRVASRLVNEADFDAERVGRTAQELLVEVEAHRPGKEARALTHGDPCLPNVIFDNGRFVGFVDCGRAGVADPYQDLALAARSIGSNLGREWVGVFFKGYGLPDPDERKLAFYRLLDEFF